MRRPATTPPAAPTIPPTRRRALLVALLLSLLLPLSLLSPAAPAAYAKQRGAGIQQREWGLKAVHAPEAWKTTKGRGVTVAVLDTGVDSRHPDLARSVRHGKDFVGTGARAGDRAWARHGTAMAGIIAGHGHGRGGRLGVKGVAPEAHILPVRVLLEDSDPRRSKARNARGGALADGIRWSVDHGADVVNLSLGDDSSSARPDAREDAAVRYAQRKGAVVVASAGNGGRKGDHVSFPAAYPGVLVATAVNRHGRPCGFSTRRWYASVAAPGKDVVIPDPSGRYYKGWGTSAATAYVSGAVALVRAAHPDLSPAQIKKLLSDTTRHPPEGGRSDALGTGLVDTAAAIDVGSHLRPRHQRPSQLPYKSAYFGDGTGEGEAGWFAVLAAVLGLLLVAGAVALHRGATWETVRDLARRRGGGP